MMITLILVGFAGLALLFFLHWIRGKGVDVVDEVSLSSRLSPLDLEAFRNLIDESEEEFLRANLSPGEYRSLRRMRLRAAVDYVSGVSRNAAVLLQLGQAARRSADPEVAEAGRRLVDSAVEVRMYALLAMCKLYVRIAVPGTVLQPVSLVDNYQRLSDGAALLGRLQSPAKRGLISSAI
jgi:hypothetical protein